MFEVALLRGIYYYCCKSDRENEVFICGGGGYIIDC